MDRRREWHDSDADTCTLLANVKTSRRLFGGGGYQTRRMTWKTGAAFGFEIMRILRSFRIGVATELLEKLFLIGNRE